MAPPSINLDLFENGMSIAQKSEKKKKLSVKQRKFQKLLADKEKNMQREKNPQNLLEK